MENALIDWQKRWGKHFQSVRLKWINQLEKLPKNAQENE
jgi:hypothetical protein